MYIQIYIEEPWLTSDSLTSDQFRSESIGLIVHLITYEWWLGTLWTHHCESICTKYFSQCRKGVEKLVELKFEFFSFNTFDVSQIFWQRVVQPRPKYSYCFSWRDFAGFLFVGYWIMHCVPCLGCFLFFIVCPIVPSIFGTVCCVIFQIYIII